jgi:hypothetical protein
MQIGKPKRVYVIEPVRDPVPRETPEPERSTDAPPVAPVEPDVTER